MQWMIPKYMMMMMMMMFGTDSFKLILEYVLHIVCIYVYFSDFIIILNLHRFAFSGS